MSQPQWEITASKKRAQLSALIPRKWTLDSSDISNTNTLRDVTLFIHTFLNAQELEITESSASEILSNVASDLWTSVEIVEAFCHRAAVAHQLVCPIWLGPMATAETLVRSIVSRKYSLTPP